MFCFHVLQKPLQPQLSYSFSKGLLLRLGREHLLLRVPAELPLDAPADAPLPALGVTRRPPQGRRRASVALEKLLGSLGQSGLTNSGMCFFTCFTIDLGFDLMILIDEERYLMN